jgi:hypothetical protein
MRKSSPGRREFFQGRHRAEHWYRDNTVYFITARCRDRFPAFDSEPARQIFWDRFLHYAAMDTFVPWVLTLMNNHYHALGHLRGIPALLAIADFDLPIPGVPPRKRYGRERIAGANVRHSSALARRAGRRLRTAPPVVSGEHPVARGFVAEPAENSHIRLTDRRHKLPVRTSNGHDSA